MDLKNNMSFENKYQEYLTIFEGYLSDSVNALSGHEKLVSAMKYSLLAGGKRIRPVLLLATVDMLGGDLKKALPFALALECVHTYSLIHDDLPAMDNDDLRRGKPTNHKVYGEDFAILAGDALLNFAFELCLDNADDFACVKASKFLAKCSGYTGMVGGQAYDLSPISCDEKQLLITDKLKTSKLISAPLVMAAHLAEKDECVDAFNKIGEYIGIIYQFVDDVLDEVGTVESLGKAVKKDADLGKVSAVKIYGLDGAKVKIEDMRLECEKLLKNFDGSEFLLEFLNSSTRRVS